MVERIWRVLVKLAATLIDLPFLIYLSWAKGKTLADPDSFRSFLQHLDNQYKQWPF